MIVILILLIIVILLIYNIYKPPKLEPGLNDDSPLETLVSKPTKTTEDKFLIGLLLADDIDSPLKTEKTKKAIKNLTTAIEEVATRQPNINDTFMINRAEDIAGNNIIPHYPNEDDFQLALALDIALNHAKQKPDAKLVQIKNAETRQEERDIAFAPIITSDAQNTHERGVLMNTREIVAILRESQPQISVSRVLSEIREECGKLQGEKSLFAIIALNKVSDESICALGQSESEILRLVWSRTYHENNADSQVLMKEAILDALVDCVDKNTQQTVCVTGRATRYIGALATLDFNHRTSEMMTYEMYKNEIFNDCKNIIEEEVQHYRNEDSILGHGAKSYENMDDSNISAEMVFKKHIKDKIIAQIASYENRLSTEDRAKVAKLCLDYADLSD